MPRGVPDPTGEGRSPSWVARISKNRFSQRPHLVRLGNQPGLEANVPPVMAESRVLGALAVDRR